ncbi:hypothetical protein YK48G_13410 [Lentilactobacillus fungorum]|uniref:Protein NO VEIN C-terminal domain-containing protein n=1 Tax=Lentilactobacillus fungorum TaxID=2201250 RepID=A0ABQ3W0W5_9LACO|nr:hypothetical protein YK48G_13410 [Lentilactobacillus fungorum]
MKSTGGNSSQPFYLTKRELEVSRKYQNQYVLVRLFDLNRKDWPYIKYYKLVGALDSSTRVNLTPTFFQVSLY